MYFVPPSFEMSGTVTTFVSNRGGIGKSSLASQLAPAYAVLHPDRTVLVLDLSIQGDASTFLLGGVAEPAASAPTVRTRGGEVQASLPVEKNAAAFLNALRAGPPPVARSSFWRGTPAPPPALDWREHAVRPAEVHPAGGCPPNLYLIPGGKRLYGTEFEGLAPELRKTLAASGTTVFVDTDAELSERGASLAGIAAADALAVVVSTSWTDYLRALDDPANSLMQGLTFLSNRHPQLTPRIAHFVFNNVQKRLGAPSGFQSAPGALPFTPPAAALESLAEISAHFRSVAVDPATNFARFFASAEGLSSADAFLRFYVTAVPAVADSAWQLSATRGQPLACGSETSEVQCAAAAHIRAVAARF
jgi:MinD-like ATPase involved in chromosome partitioning or flagellar assembly